ncbi:hypothetical protein CON22_25995 [Bacillus cereus]|nr:hypothetical protein CON22_25995 [Bacillus cereus]
MNKFFKFSYLGIIAIAIIIIAIKIDAVFFLSFWIKNYMGKKLIKMSAVFFRNIQKSSIIYY